jgi:hypothetical protein
MKAAAALNEANQNPVSSVLLECASAAARLDLEGIQLVSLCTRVISGLMGPEGAEPPGFPEVGSYPIIHSSILEFTLELTILTWIRKIPQPP